MTSHNRRRYWRMSNEPNRVTKPDQPMVYQLRIRGQLGSQWSDWFGGLTITAEANGDTLVTGAVVDQAALHGLLKKMRDLAMPLIAVMPVANADEARPGQSTGG